MAYEALKQRVWKANMDLVKSGLVVLTWGNASEIDREAGVFAIKPSGVDYDSLKPEDIVVLSLEDCKPVEDGALKPSSDTATHLKLYQAFDLIAGVVHTHSVSATAWAQAGREIPCLGTTHADTFYGPVPVTRQLTQAEIDEAYELHTGTVIIERFQDIDPAAIPAVLVTGHAPFTWGHSAAKAVENAVVLETVAQMALQTFAANPETGTLPQMLLDKHYLRKHGANAYYGQK